MEKRKIVFAKNPAKFYSLKIFQLILYFMRQSEGAASRRLMMDVREKTRVEGREKGSCGVRGGCPKASTLGRVAKKGGKYGPLSYPSGVEGVC